MSTYSDIRYESGGAVTVYANLAAFPGSGNSVGDYAWATNTKALYIWDGAEWDRINSDGDEAPRLTTTPASSVKLNGDGTNTAITIAASDPESFPITYTYDTNPSSPNQITNVVENSGVFTLVPSTNQAHAGDFTLRLKADDGVHITSHSIAVNLGFQTNFTFDTDLSTISSTYTDTNKVRAYVSASTGTARSEQNVRTGKGYLEYKVITTASYMMLGLGWDNYNGGYSSATSTYVYSSGGTRYPGGYSLPGMGSFGVNDIIMIAYDTAPSGQTSVPRIWWGKNGSWATATPGTDTGFPFTIPDNTTPSNWDTTNQYLRPVFHYGGGSAANYDIEIISHTQGAQYTIPTGWSLA